MLVVLFLLVIFIAYTLVQNKNPELNEYNIKIGKNIKPQLLAKKIDNKENLKELLIYQISDLHNYKFGRKQSKILKLMDEDPDYIFITGDLIDRRQNNIANALILIDELTKRYRGKIYFISGNHEKGSDQKDELYNYLRKMDVVIMDNESFVEGNLNFIGLEDPNDYINKKRIIQKDNTIELRSWLEKLIDHDKINILLSHQPHLMNIYRSYGADIVFSGHTHGGQARIFGIPVYGPAQGLFPKYAGGIFIEGHTIMLNSRGLGNNFWFAKRVFNRPELAKVNLYIDI